MHKCCRYFFFDWIRCCSSSSWWTIAPYEGSNNNRHALPRHVYYRSQWPRKRFTVEVGDFDGLLSIFDILLNQNQNKRQRARRYSASCRSPEQMTSLHMSTLQKHRRTVCYHHPVSERQRLTSVAAVDYADLEALDISKLDEPGGKEALAKQVLSFINKNGESAQQDPPCRELLVL